jgi:hypothetical protein
MSSKMAEYHQFHSVKTNSKKEDEMEEVQFHN